MDPGERCAGGCASLMRDCLVFWRTRTLLMTWGACAGA